MLVTLFELIKRKRGTHQPWWGKWEGNHFADKMAVCRYLWTWHLSAYHFSQLGIWLIYMVIHFHYSCHSFESFKGMHCPPSHCVFVWSSHAAKSFVVPPDVQREVKKVYLCSQNSLCVSTFESVLWLLHSHYSRTMFEFHVVDVGFIMALLQREYSYRHQLIIQEIVLEKNFSTLRSVCLNDKFSHSQNRFTSLTFYR